MSHTKRTYALPDETVRAFESNVPSGQRSNLIATLLQQWLSERRRLAIRNDVIEGCREMADISRELERDFHPLEEEVHRGLDSPTKARRRRSRPA